METAEQVLQEAANRSATTTPNLYVVNLAAGDHTGFNIDFDNWTGNDKKYHSVQWMSQGYDGILF